MGAVGLTYTERRRRAEETLAGCTLVFRSRGRLPRPCRKTPYSTIAEARHEMRRIQHINWRKDTGRLTVYFCRKCRAYHFGNDSGKAKVA